MSDNYREIRVGVLREHEKHLASLRISLAPHKVDDAGLFQIALSCIGELIHRATIVKCPHAKHALDHIGIGEFLRREKSKRVH